MTTVTVNDTFDAPVERVWPLVSDFGGLVGIMRGVEECRLEGSGLGVDRIVNGAIVERLTWLDHDDHAFSYTIVSGPIPFRRYVATVKLSPAGERTDIEWEGNFEPDGVPEEEAAEMARKIYTGGIKGYKSALAR
jgi:hypothetical protein